MSNIITAGNATNNGTSISSDTSGVLELKTGSTPTTALTISTGQVVTFAQQPAGTFAGTGPAFSAYMAANQTVTSGVLTKLTLNTKVFDTNNNFDNVTNYRFTPTVGGYYQISMSLLMNGATTAAVVALYKNGSLYTNTVYFQAAGVSTQYPLSVLIYLNGSTDYLEFYGQTNGGTTIGGGSTGTFASGCLVRSA
jgi:hypothetical protein